jgi:hypothetical protein
LAFKRGVRCPACFSKENCSLAAYLRDYKTDEITPHWFSKALGATPSHLFSNRSIGFELAGFEKLSANSKAFGTKQLRTY